MAFSSMPHNSIEVKLPDPQTWPSVACTPQELQRLRQSYKAEGLAHDVVARQVQQANSFLLQNVEFPPEGGQHNQWYQCDKCQIALKTIDDKHHQCPGCGEIYSGYPYDNVIYSRKHYALTRGMETCAWAYGITEDEKYAQRVRDILVGYAQRYMNYPYLSANMGKKTDPPSRSGGHVFEQTLNESSWMSEVCISYDLTRTSKVYSEPDHKAIKDELLWKVYENIDKNKAGKSNWQTYHNSAFMFIGGVLNEEELIRKALEDKENGFYFQMQASVLPGGMWYENSWGYHFYTLAAVQRITETARRLGINLYDIPQVKEMHTVALDYQMADGTLPRFGDATTIRISGGYYEVAYHQWKEQAFLSMLPKTPTWQSVLLGRTEVPDPYSYTEEFKSVLKEGAGHAILKTNGKKGKSSAVLTFGPFGGFHGHFDKLSFVYFAIGKELGYDPGRALSQAYRLPIHRDWYRATTSHNTVLIDRKSQEGVEGTCQLFINGPDISACGAYTDKAYAGVIHRRLLILRPDFLVVFDLLEAHDGKDHIFDWMYHNLGDRIYSEAASQDDQVLEGQGFEYIKDLKTGVTDSPVNAIIDMGKDRVQVLVGEMAGSQVTVGMGVGESIMHRVPLIFITRKGQKTHFAAVIEPIPEGQNEIVKSVKLIENAGETYIIHIQMKDGGKESYLYDLHKSVLKME